MLTFTGSAVTRSIKDELLLRARRSAFKEAFREATTYGVQLERPGNITYTFTKVDRVVKCILKWDELPLAEPEEREDN